uniref:Helicase C-terminal domain-containing protein n=1 Tax=Solanum lycopersicum TaxID=4081 RepID=A0A3Q7EYI9_SOLLC
MDSLREISMASFNKPLGFQPELANKGEGVGSKSRGCSTKTGGLNEQRTKVTVMLMSLKAGNLGLNMVAASHVILLDLWWNPTTEDQAIDRAHRIGQTRAVTVSRLTVKDTVEDRIIALQEDKRNMVASAFGEDQSGGTASRLTVEDLRYLFNL